MNLDSQVRPAYYRIIAVFQIASFSTHQIVSRQNLTLNVKAPNPPKDTCGRYY